MQFRLLQILPGRYSFCLCSIVTESANTPDFHLDQIQALAIALPGAWTDKTKSLLALSSKTKQSKNTLFWAIPDYDIDTKLFKVSTRSFFRTIPKVKNKIL